MTYSLYNNLDLPECTFVAGTPFTLEFPTFEEDGVSPFDLSGCSVLWVLCPDGNFNLRTIQKSGTITSASTFKVVLNTLDTENLSGKYIQQPIIVSPSGTLRCGQGIVLITQKIQ
jgi:hypothetical protein